MIAYLCKSHVVLVSQRLPKGGPAALLSGGDGQPTSLAAFEIVLGDHCDMTRLASDRRSDITYLMSRNSKHNQSDKRKSKTARGKARESKQKSRLREQGVLRLSPKVTTSTQISWPGSRFASIMIVDYFYM